MVMEAEHFQICSPQAGEPGKPRAFQCKLGSEGGRKPMSQLEDAEKANSPLLSLLFYSDLQKFSGCDCCPVCEGAARSLLQGGVTGTPDGPLGACPEGASLILAAAAVATESCSPMRPRLGRLWGAATATVPSGDPTSSPEVSEAVARAGRPRGKAGPGQGLGRARGAGSPASGQQAWECRRVGPGLRAGRPGCSGSPPPRRQQQQHSPPPCSLFFFSASSLLLLSLSELPPRCPFFSPFPLEPRFSRSSRSLREHHGNFRRGLARAASPLGRSHARTEPPRAAGGRRDSGRGCSPRWSELPGSVRPASPRVLTEPGAGAGLPDESVQFGCYLDGPGLMLPEVGMCDSAKVRGVGDGDGANCGRNSWSLSNNFPCKWSRNNLKDETNIQIFEITRRIKVDGRLFQRCFAGCLFSPWLLFGDRNFKSVLERGQECGGSKTNNGGRGHLPLVEMKHVSSMPLKPQTQTHTVRQITKFWGCLGGSVS
ncbi:uncharacterized protein LOC125095515 [Lutra lutra]|uniref:uncharacterized protein LOC125095515 n=1 Tax=Lutra lutra TaxID=9657 RepID=UPI001FD2BCA4|nr:uncharacterized protein LOC125095515 [Lutra lutra]